MDSNPRLHCGQRNLIQSDLFKSALRTLSGLWKDKTSLHVKPFPLIPSQVNEMVLLVPTVHFLKDRTARQSGHCTGNGLPQGCKARGAQTLQTPAMPLSVSEMWTIEVCRPTIGADLIRLSMNLSTLKPSTTTWWAMSIRREDKRAGMRPATMNAKMWSKL